MKKSFIALILAAMFSFMSLPIVSAEPETSSSSEPAQTEQNEQTEQQDFQNNVTENGEYMEDTSLTPPDTQHSKAALLIDMNTGRLLYGKNIDERLYPASTTKIMTAILAIESGTAPDEVLTATYQALESITLEDSHMGILIGEELTFEQLLTGMLVYSANDAANVLAIHTAGSIDAFVDLMNKKAQELGMTNTNFVTACGTHDDNHYTTARDLAILSQYAMKNEQFRNIVKMPIYKIPPTNKYASERILVNTNLFLGTSRSTYYYYPPCTGIKTGHTSQAGYCLVSSALYNDTEFLSVVLGCDNADTGQNAYSYIDSKNMFTFGFDNYITKTIAANGDMVSDAAVAESKGNMRAALTVETDVKALVPADDAKSGEIVTNIDVPDDLAAPIKKGDIVGTVTYNYRGVQIGMANLVSTNDVERNEFIHILNLVIKVVTSPFFFIPAIIIIIVAFIANRQKKKRERQRRIQQLKRNKQKLAENEILQKTPDRNASRTERVSHESKGSNSRYKGDLPTKRRY